MHVLRFMIHQICESLYYHNIRHLLSTVYIRYIIIYIHWHVTFVIPLVYIYTIVRYINLNFKSPTNKHNL